MVGDPSIPEDALPRDPLDQGRAIVDFTLTRRFRGRLRQGLMRDRWLYVMLLFPLVHILVFLYIPMWGVTVAFKEFNVFMGYWQSPWVGLKHFQRVVEDQHFWIVFRNSLKFGIASLVLGFPAPIILALLLSQFRQQTYKGTVQTLLYIPNFISMVAIAGIMVDLLEPRTGLVNRLITLFGGTQIYFLVEPAWFLPIYIGSEVWQTTGFGMIIYLAAMSGIDPDLHEAATMDGAGRFRRALTVTLPGIMPTIAILLILRIPTIIHANFEKILLLYRPITYDVADVIQSYIYRKGLLGADFTYGTAAGLFLSVLSLILLAIANSVSRRVSEYRLW